MMKLHKWADVRRSRLMPERDAKVQRRVQRTLKAMGAKKQTSDRVSALAARLMAKCRGRERSHPVVISVRNLRALCASVLSQDETKGKRRKVRK